MSSSKRTPSALRYMKARLKPLSKPMFWCPAMVLMVSTAFFWEYWTHPEWLQQVEGNGPGSDQVGLGSSPEDRAIGADIDSLPVLINELEEIAIPALDPDSPLMIMRSQEPDTQSLLLQKADEATDNTAASAKLSQPTPRQTGLSLLGTSTPDYGLANTTAGLSGFLGNPTSSADAINVLSSDTSSISSGLGLSSRRSSLQSDLSALTNPLQAALEDQAAIKQQATSLSESSNSRQLQVRESEQTTTPGRNLVSGEQALSTPGVAPSSIVPQQALPSNLSFIRTTPQMSPPPGSTGYTPPSTLSSPNLNRNFRAPGNSFTNLVTPQTPSLVPNPSTGGQPALSNINRGIGSTGLQTPLPQVTVPQPAGPQNTQVDQAPTPRLQPRLQIPASIDAQINRLVN
ncbi:MAG: hypothetical protein F6K19_28580 [Cyanothece sp. SIO1E1]|nr:hypothetical protein [Cyanothece sp. SIO1E1]